MPHAKVANPTNLPLLDGHFLAANLLGEKLLILGKVGFVGLLGIGDLDHNSGHFTATQHVLHV